MSDGGRGIWKSELRGTLALAGPIVLGNIGQVLIGVVDTMMIGQIGVAPLGAAAFVNNIFIVPFVSLVGLLAAVTILVSQSKGARDERAVGRHLRHGVALSLVVSVAALALLGANYLALDYYGQEPEVVEAAKGYYWLIMLSLVPALVYQALKSVWEGLGWSNPPMLTLIAGIGLNVLLNWLLIFGKFGFPELGLLGAGWATLIARTAIAVTMFWLTLRARRFARYRPRRWASGFEWSAFRRMLGLGVPMAAQHLFEVGAFAGAGIMIGWIGKEALAAHQIAISCASMAFMLPLGVSIACGIRVGEAWGGGNTHRVKAIFLSALAFGFALASMVATLFLVAGGWLASGFVDEPQVVEAAAAILVVVGLFQIFDGAQVTTLGALRGMSDVNVPMGITFVTYWIIALPVGYVFGFWLDFGAVGVWSGLALGLCCASVCLLARLRRLSSR